MASWLFLALFSFSFSAQALQNLDTCFSPNNSCEKKIMNLFVGAQQSIDVAVFSFSHKDIRDALLAAKKNGVNIRVIMDRDQAASKSSVAASLAEAGIELRYGVQEGSMHHKFAIVDREWIQMGSFNYTYFAASKSAESQIYMNEPAVIKSFQQEFENVWDKAQAASF